MQLQTHSVSNFYPLVLLGSTKVKVELNSAWLQHILSVMLLKTKLHLKYKMKTSNTSKTNNNKSQ